MITERLAGIRDTVVVIEAEAASSFINGAVVPIGGGRSALGRDTGQALRREPRVPELRRYGSVAGVG